MVIQQCLPFPEIFFKKNFIRSEPIGCIVGDDLSGWRTKEFFLEFIEYFVRQARCTNKWIFLFLEISISHLSFGMFHFSLSLLILPHWIQSLDRILLDPLNKLSLFHNTWNKWSFSHNIHKWEIILGYQWQYLTSLQV